MILTRAVFVATTIFLTVRVTGGTDCTPTGTHLSDTTDGACGYMNSSSLSKHGYWNISWPDGYLDSLGPYGSGQCTWNSNCDLFSDYGTTYCWPLFYTPIANSSGEFSIRVDDRVTVPEIHDCPNGISSERRVYCNTSAQGTFEKDHTCCQPNPQDPHDDCMSEACASCYEEGGTYCTGDGGNCWTPIIVDVAGDGFNLTNATNGVNFNDGAGTVLHTAWTTANSDDAWLVLDRNGNGVIDDATELFGNAAPQPPVSGGELKNGFRALSDFDKPANGGNGDGVIDARDTIFTSLRLWQDRNHNGISELSELHSLSQLGLAAIELDYKLSKRGDGNNNTFRYRARVTDIQGSQLGRWAYDVFLDARPAQ